MSEEPARMVSLDAVIAILDRQSAAPDGYYYAKQHERIIGWYQCINRIRADVEALAE